VYRKNSLDGFQFNYYFIVHDQVDFVSTIELQAFIRNGEVNLAFEGQSAEMQFVTKALFIGGFQQSGTELTMDFDRCTNDHGRSRVLLVFGFSVSP
jgi:hypothetical protein